MMMMKKSYLSDTSEIRQTIMQVNQALTRRTETVEELRRRLTETEDSYVKEIQELQSKIAQLQGEIVRSTLKMTDMEEQLRHIRQIESENKNLHETIQLMTQREEAMKRAQEGNQYMLQELEDKDHIILNHISKIDQLEMEIENLKEQRSVSDKELSMLKKELDIAHKRRVSQQNDFISSKQLEHEESEKQLREAHQKEIEKLNQTIQELEQRLEDALYTASENENLIRKRHFQDFMKTKEEMNQITIQRDALNSEYRDLDGMYNDVLLQNKQLAQELEKWKMKHSTMADIVKSKKEENEQLHRKLDKLQSDFDFSTQKNSAQVHMIKMEHISALDNIRRQNAQFMDALQRKLDPQEESDAFKLQCVKQMRRAQEHFTEELSRLTREILLHPNSYLKQEEQMQDHSTFDRKISNQTTVENVFKEMDKRIEESKVLILGIERECAAMFDVTSRKERESARTLFEQSKLASFLKTSMDRHIETLSQLRERYTRDFNRMKGGMKDERILQTGAQKLVRHFATEIGRAELAFSSTVTQMKLIDDKELWLDQASQQMKLDAAREQLYTLYDNLAQNNDNDVNMLLETIAADEEHVQRESVLYNIIQQQQKVMDDMRSKIGDVMSKASNGFTFERSFISTLFHQLASVYWKEKDEIRSQFTKLLQNTKTVSNVIDVEDIRNISITAERVKHLCSLVDILFEFGTLAQRHSLNLETRALKTSGDSDKSSSSKKGKIDEEELHQYREKRLKFDRILLSKLENRIDTIRKAISSDEQVDSDSDNDLEDVEPDEMRVSARLGDKMRVLKHQIKHLIKRYKISEQQCQQLKNGILGLRKDRRGNLVQPKKSHEKTISNADLNDRFHQVAQSDPKFILAHVMDIIGAKDADNVIVLIMQLVERTLHVPQYVRFMRYSAIILEQEKRLPNRVKTMGTIVTETGEIFNLDFLFSKIKDMQEEANHTRNMSDFIHRVQTELEKSIISMSVAEDHVVYQKFFFTMKILVHDYNGVIVKDYPRTSMIRGSSSRQDGDERKNGWKALSEEETQQRETLEYVRQLLQVSNIDPIRSRVRGLVVRERQQSEEIKVLQRQYHKFIEMSSQLRAILDVDSTMDIVPRVSVLSKETKRVNQAYPKLQNLLNDLCRTVQVSRVDELLPSVRKLAFLSRSMGHMLSDISSPPSGPGSPQAHRGKSGYKDTRSTDTTDISETTSFTVDDFIDVLLHED